MEWLLIERIVAIVAPVLIVVLVGYAYARRRAPDMTAINRVNMDVFVPSLIFSALTTRGFSIYDNRWLLLASALIVLGSGVIGWAAARIFRVDARTFVPPMMFNNCGNMGLPLGVLAYGAGGLSAAVAMFVVSNLFHFTIGAKIVDRKASIRSLLLLPMNVATAAGLAWAATGWVMPGWIASTIELLGDAMIPVMLFALGVRMTSVTLAGWRVGLLGAIVCPLSGLAIALPLDAWLPLTPDQRGLMYIFASLPPAVLNFMVAERYRQEPDKVASIVLIGNLAGIVFVPLGLLLALR